ncbi:protein of unknown function [Flavobacterium aquidurense]|uniref:DUF4861 domain-containing protein n=1 Tax=Flavobacterium frigidimaris TaxID=262320 RepID=A0ABX4BL84_FLAFR|nr:DUF4861 family protein [Flavobacterium frigidimaris]OXA76448.1 DUF4861 domain-containing protein [Flavobacterium frigidimaris]SDZ64704.1 protein of unknown function [Flavobacterium aquidurense]
MKKHILLTTILASSFALHSQNKFIIITNSLAVEREFETVELTKIALGLSNSVKLEEFAVKEKNTNLVLESQTVDNDGDGIMDVLLFQPKISASSQKEFEIVSAAHSSAIKNSNCYSRFVPERTDDYAWENNKVAFRTYGPVAQKMVEDKIPGGTLTSGIDAWLKRVEYPIIDKWYEKTVSGTGSYHKDTGEGLDNFQVGPSRGIGGIAVNSDGKYYFSKNFISWKTITTGPIRTSFILTYADWDANGNKITESKLISLDYGSYLSRFEITIAGTKTIAAGLTLHDNKGTIGTNLKEGWLSHWEPIDDSEIGMGLVAPKNTLISFDNYVTNEKDLSNLYGNLKVKDNKVVYFAGFGWKKGSPFQTKTEWETYLSSFAKKVNNPLIVKVKK